MTKRGLGRGLSALIPGAPEAGGTAAGTGLLELPVNAITPNPRQPRTTFDEAALESMVASVREVGVLQPVVVRTTSDGYELIAGERRFRAAQRAGLATIPAIVRESDDVTSLQEAIIENIQREDLNPIELAEALRELQEELGATQELLAERVSMSRSSIANTIRLLQLPAGVQTMVADGKIQAGHARALLSIGDGQAQETLALRIAAEDLSVREVEELVRRYIDQPRAVPTKGKKKAGQPDVSASPLAEVEEILSEQLATRVKIQMGAKRGKIIVDFGSPDDLERIVSEIIGSGPGLAPD
ncbi:MAG: ParB/RepB/Spo0J family partition protein [Actinomycetota bacterium]